MAGTPLVSTFLELVDARRESYDELVGALHDALVFHARLDDEFAARPRTSAQTRAIARKRFLAHQLTVALGAAADFDRRYPR